MNIKIIVGSGHIGGICCDGIDRPIIICFRPFIPNNRDFFAELSKIVGFRVTGSVSLTRHEAFEIIHPCMSSNPKTKVAVTVTKKAFGLPKYDLTGKVGMEYLKAATSIEIVENIKNKWGEQDEKGEYTIVTRKVR